MFLDIAARHGVDLSRSTHVGDSDSDRAAAIAAGLGRFIPAHASSTGPPRSRASGPVWPPAITTREPHGRSTSKAREVSGSE